MAGGLALAVLVGGWVGLHRGFYRHSQIVDTPIYQRYGDAIASGHLPYRDFGLEYPPGALPVFAIPSLVRSQDGDLAGYRRGFEAEMLACGALALLFMLSILLRLEARPGRLAGALGLAAVAPLLLGSVVLSRFDLWPAALTAGALAALVAGRHRIGLGALGLAFATKLYPAALLPLGIAWVWRRAGRREAALAVVVFAAAALLVFLPFVALAPDGVWEALRRQTDRPLQIETLGAGFLLVLHQIAGLGLTMHSSHGSQNLAGAGPDALAAVQTALQLAVLVGIWIWFARGPAERERLVRAAAAVVCAFVALGKVLSPQFLLWLVPLVPLVRGRRGLAAGGLLAAALVVTQLWFPFRYWDLALEFAAFPSWLVLVRDLVLVALLAVLVWPERRVTPRPA
ncbi:MAG TPA: glycosyltransferase 87 family protein [Gaiellaceae bacterium]|nr:glycosyltransferase 87 family protein [Gaiellaceae bacterium]